MFHDTVAANLRYAKADASDEELVAVCRAARIDDLIATLPEGYATLVGERGYRLSGGEKQRLALARVLLKSPAIVILDEATAHLDSETELLIQQALAEALAGRTSLVIAHRLSTIQAADQILVVDQGRIVERGTHAELVDRDGLYRGSTSPSTPGRRRERAEGGPCRPGPRCALPQAAARSRATEARPRRAGPGLTGAERCGGRDRRRSRCRCGSRWP